MIVKAVFSPYLDAIAPGLKQLAALLGEKYDYVSVLSTDSVGFAVSISQRAKAVNHSTMTTERGSVVRVCRGGLYSEYAFNRFDPAHPERTAAEAERALEEQFALLRATDSAVYETPVLPDEPCVLREEMETGSMPEDCDLGALVERFTEISARGVAAGEHAIDCHVRGQSTHVCKLFLTAGRDMRQSYVYSEGMVAVIASKDGAVKFGFDSVSGREGPELFGKLDELAEKVAGIAEELLVAERIEPGEYEVIVSPEISGLIAHEAFGHGVEMDMFVKNRALGAQYIGKRVGSDLVTMHEGAKPEIEVASYAFDDEGTLAHDTVEIRNGILKTGVCDALSALRLGVEPTGNGKRENFEHKVYTRMTNTVFESGESTLEEMIATVKYGYLLRGMQSGMEDPKHWGIQCILDRGYEIRDGKLTGRIVSPIVMTGYVPELLGSISMLSRDHELFGSGGCGKGHKEWVKVSDGGPYLLTRARLG
jgi:TldD protein